jgi:LAS superfamily LD-carboxypeptidase LdcB
MRSTTYLLAATVAASLLAGGVVRSEAQSLADLARQEDARRKQIKEPARVISNKDLAPVPPPATQSPPAPPAAANKATDTDKAAAKDEKPVPSSKDVPRDQAYWSKQMKALDAQLDRDQLLAEALQTRINALTADFTARDDPAQRAVLARDRLKAIDELDRLKKAIQADRKAIGDFEEEARRASVPPGWLR